MPQADSVSSPPRLPLVALPENRDSTTAKDARLVNGYIEQSPTEGLFVYKRPGLAVRTSVTAATAGGTFNWKGSVYAIFGNKLYKDGSAVAGTVDTSSFLYCFSSTLGATPRLFFHNGVKAYNYDSGAGLVQVTDVNYPAATVLGSSYLDGTTYIMDSSAKTYGDSINDTTTWPALNTLIAQIEPDGGVALSKQLVYILALKEWTTEVFFDAANATGSPLGPVQGARINFGCASSYSVQNIDDKLIWLSANRSAGYQIVLLEKLKADVVSTKPVERLLSKATLTAGNIFSWTFRRDGHIFYGITLKAQNITLVYDLVEKLWSQWTDANGNYFPIVSATYKGSSYYLQHESNGVLYDIDALNYTDAGSTITVDIYTPNFDGDTRREKYVSMMEFIADQAASSVLQVRMSDDDYQTWTNFRPVDLSVLRPQLPSCGSFFKRAHHLRHSSPTPFRIKAVEMEIDMGTL